MNNWLMSFGHEKPNPDWSREGAGVVKNGCPEIDVKAKFSVSEERKSALVNMIRELMTETFHISKTNIYAKMIADANNLVDTSIIDEGEAIYPYWFYSKAFNEAKKQYHGSASSTEIKMKKIDDLRKKNMSSSAIAKELGCGRSTINEYIRTKERKKQCQA